MSTNMTIDGYVANFDGFKNFTAKNDKQNYDSCSLKVNIANYSKNSNGETVYTMVDLYGTGQIATFLDKYEKKDRIICHADFNGINSYVSKNETKTNIRATVRNIVLLPPKDRDASDSTTSSAPQVNNSGQPPQITPPQGFTSSTGITPSINVQQPNVTPPVEIPQVNNTSGRKQKRK